MAEKDGMGEMNGTDTSPLYKVLLSVREVFNWTYYFNSKTLFNHKGI